jgi:septal ring factor EnvC (AmiA/AmiB activator)
MTGDFNVLVAAILTILFIIIFYLYQREMSTVSKLHKAVTTIADVEKELDEVNAGACGQETLLGKCRGDLSSCENKTAESEMAITSMMAELEETKEKLATCEESLKLHKHLTFELKRAVDNSPCGFGVSKPVHFEDASRLATRIDDQRFLIRQLRKELVDREARINGLTKKLYWSSGLY